MYGSTARRDPSGTTHHLVPAEVWAAQRDGETYRPEAYETDGFVHCTDGIERLLVPANAYYRDDPRPYLALTLDVAAVGSPVRYDDEACIYPHVYGPVATASVIEVHEVVRDADGTFTGFRPTAGG